MIYLCLQLQKKNLQHYLHNSHLKLVDATFEDNCLQGTVCHADDFRGWPHVGLQTLHFQINQKAWLLLFHDW